MLKKYKTILSLLIVLIICSFYKSFILYIFPNLNTYQTKLIEEGLQVITVLIFITGMKLWHSVGSITKISKKSILFMLPIIVLSFIPLFNGIVTYQISTILMVMGSAIFIGFSEELACRGVILSANTAPDSFNESITTKESGEVNYVIYFSISTIQVKLTICWLWILQPKEFIYFSNSSKLV